MNTLMSSLDLQALREEFPLLGTEARGRIITYLDSAATTQKPYAVLREMQLYYQQSNANVHRGVYKLSQKATELYEGARDILAAFIHAPTREEVIFTKGCTEAVNLVANSLNVRGETVLLSQMEHHSNIVPWQLAGAKTVPIPINDQGEIDLDAYADLLKTGPKLVGVVAISNAIGTVNPIQKMAQMAHEAGALILVDGAQALAHQSVNVQEWDVDFLAMSAHKMYGPTGTGALWGRKALFDEMPPYQGGGDMIRTVAFEGSTYADIPNKFEAGTPNIAGVVGWAAAIAWLQAHDRDAIANHEAAVHRLLRERLAEVPGLRMIGNAAHQACIQSFVMDEAHPHDIATILDQQGICVRAGHHCCQPLMMRYKVPATVRASLGVYNTEQEIDRLVHGLQRVKEVFA